MKENKRKHLMQSEVEKMMAAAENGRDPERNTCLLWMCFVHGFRVSELGQLSLSDMDVAADNLYIRRLKNGLSTTHPLSRTEKNLLTRWLNCRSRYPRAAESHWLFLSRKGGHLSRSRIYRILKELGEMAGLPVPVHPHMLRHACGYALADKGADTRLIQDYLGHRNIQHTVLYTAANAGRFRGLWD
ncbi:tyrosine-type DNA invertase [Morganella morganii]|uniref:tyrosine-type DNA invertase n=1 Tax=Morganella morganii TaxID=582 RepID=UPI001E522CE8|nr:tyrosine-type DNA invertase [Morganella morganii]EKU5841772.1 tyrosine-type recombinase/integrase [Morganella morganii]UFH68972.1 tyrosine-type recombinase/integrase [Morganella morganii]HDF2329289.1 tyrosine-type recombinase/integrase [Morganella morganii]